MSSACSCTGEFAVRVLIRFLARSVAGTVERRDRVFEGDSLTLGRATDRVLHLKDRRVALKHARILRSGGRILITSSASAGVIVNDAVQRDAQLHTGDTVSIGSNLLRLFEPPAGFDLAFTFELDPAARAVEAPAEAPRLSLADLGLGARGPSWLLLLGVLALCLLVPALGVRDAQTQQVLRSTPLPDDGWWRSGALHPVHGTLNTRCERCHQQPFRRVRDQACLSCHAGSLHTHTEDDAGFPAARCTDCHSEHQPAQLVRTGERLCAGCHDAGGHAGHGDRLAELVATDFLHDHPPFRIAGLDPSGQDASGLIFPHDVHLDPAGLKAPQGMVVLQCADCHRPEPGGARMQPVRMEEHCQSCHRLDFDPADPQRQAPHADAGQVLQTLIEYYSARYLESYPDPLALAQPRRTARRPGVALTAAERERALELARSRAQTIARDLFERRVCASCHEVQSDGAQWRVEPAQLIERWMPHARFDHSRHATAASPCASCHAAHSSGAATDVLMPHIDQCRQCHAGSRHVRAGSDRVPSTCTLCHDFHLDAHPLWPHK
jgi:predicted CXXCH cytochrome family protein